jgi:hypothetical protein
MEKKSFGFCVMIIEHDYIRNMWFYRRTYDENAVKWISKNLRMWNSVAKNVYKKE